MRRKIIRNKGLKKVIGKDKKINYKGLIAIVLGFIFINFAIYLYVSVEKTEQVFGQVVMLNDTTSESAAQQRIVVVLEDGKTVQALLPNSLPFQKNSRVKLIKTKTKLFGVEKYRFAGYQ